MTLSQQARSLGIKLTKVDTVHLPYLESSGRKWLLLLQEFLKQYPEHDGDLQCETCQKEGHLESIIVTVEVPKSDNELLVEIKEELSLREWRLRVLGKQ